MRAEWFIDIPYHANNLSDVKFTRVREGLLTLGLIPLDLIVRWANNIRAKPT